MKLRILSAAALVTGALAAGPALAQQPPAAPPDLNAIPAVMPFNIPFGTPITADRAIFRRVRIADERHIIATGGCPAY